MMGMPNPGAGNACPAIGCSVDAQIRFQILQIHIGLAALLTSEESECCRKYPIVATPLRAQTRVTGNRDSQCSAMKFAFAGTHSRYAEVTAAMERYLIQTLRKPTALDARAKNSKQKKPLTPSSVSN